MEFHESTITRQPCVSDRQEAQEAVSTSLHDLSRPELLQHIQDCDQLMQESYAQYEAHGCFSDHADACRWQRLMFEAIAARNARFTPGEVTAWEKERGLN